MENRGLRPFLESDIWLCKVTQYVHTKCDQRRNTIHVLHKWPDGITKIEYKNGPSETQRT